MSNDISGFKLITGEDVIAEVEAKTELDVILKNPVGVTVVRGPDGTPNVGFSPFPLYAKQEKDAEVIVKLKHIVYNYEPAEDFVEQYNQIFGAGIVVPKKSIITG